MIEFKRHTLSNGLRVIVHTDDSSPLATFNVLYKVGARNENEHRTGFAHLFEHLMFGGSRNVPQFDTALQTVGGESNAYTTNDLTNYYITIPAANIETAFWLESDRMLEPAFSEEKLDIQRGVVVEEFKQRCLNKPYGDLQHLIRDLAYKVHPYRWPTIGLEPNHITDASLDEVKQFFYSHYSPDNAIISIVGNVDADEMFSLAEKWFGDISRQTKPDIIAPEPPQTEQRIRHVARNVPAHNITLAYHMDGRTSRDYYVLDIVTDILADGASSKLVQRMTKKEKIMAEVNAYVLGSIDPGLLVLTGTLLPNADFDTAEKAFREELMSIANGNITDNHLQKVKNRTEAYNTVSETSLLAKATNLAYYEMLGDADMINNETKIYDSVTKDEICQTINKIVIPQNESVLRYEAQPKK